MISLLTFLLALLGMNTSPTFANLGVDEFAALIAQKGVVVLDVRTAEEFAEGHIAGAVNIDVNAVDFEKKVASLLLKKGTPLAVYCRSGRRSANACGILAKAGYKNISNLSTGIIGWTEAGKPTVK